MSDTLINGIQAGEFARFMEKFEPFDGKIAIAVSGGPDSMALAFCAKRWAPHGCVAFIVEHGLREESADEAAAVKERLQQIGIETEILPWMHEKIPSRLHEVARNARYELLFSACDQHGAKDLLIAHHGGDQAETILMRLAKGSGIDGLAGIAEQNIRSGIRMLRPLLSVSKERLLATCEEAKIAYVTDPSNASHKYKRGRLREIMPLLANEGFSEESFAATATKARDAKDALDFYMLDLLCKSAKAGIGGSISIERKAFCDVPKAVALRALAYCLRFVHYDDYPPEYLPLLTLHAAIKSSTQEYTATLYGCIVSASDQRIVVLREPSAARETLPIQTGSAVLWDKRWIVSAVNAPPEANVRALGNPPHNIIDELAPKLRHQVPQGRIRAALPAIWVKDKLYAIPLFEDGTAFKTAYAKQTFP